ncbi:MAG: DUF5661 family protein [bacterium]
MPKKYFSEEEARDAASKIGIIWDDVSFDLAQFTAGMNVELEHGARDPETNITNDDALTTGKIAWAHLKEISDYYDLLEIMEKEAEK